MAKKIMLQGTGSSVGKSIITAAFCRIFKEDGYSVAPFKSQNMSLNSFVTKDGLEMGRAQVVQAEAAKIEPIVDMNPILLKPTSQIGSQVIVRGKVYKNMKAEDYYKEKHKLVEIIKKSFNKLDKLFEIVVIEGAGSPAEINLRENDIVNMGLAEMVDSPVILVGDIDKGGVFASIYGTIMLLEKKERDRIKGFIINKFRGDIKILEPGIKMLEEKIGKPCLGVIPYMELYIDDEDSETSRFKQKNTGGINIGVVKTPYISNFSDFTPFDFEKDVNVRYIVQKKDFDDIDMIILPGSKNTIADMNYIFEKGFDREIYKKHKKGIPIMGICGGYQMLGLEIVDFYSVESILKRINGLSLLEIRTTMKKTKCTKQVFGKIIADNCFLEQNIDYKIEGYEIHMGETELIGDSKPFIKLDEGRYDGAISADGKVFGTYLHGIFENDNFREKLVNWLKQKKGIEVSNCNMSYKEIKEKEYAKLAEIVRKHVDLDGIKKIMGLK
ncbi:cobyric acid synthase [Caloranaerobacter ferrireducens]|uniref:cobyric acid synthase n=1 Tax=Caloranaerobacter ferrireducens TaxID=1323370 RepID=UPI00084D4AC9|nr:cobyric acid synthase [Caloranaerobacter ferrireducens]